MVSFFFFLVILYSFGFQVIFSMADEYVPEYVDKKALVDRYYTIFLKSKITVGTFDITYSTSLYFIYNSHCYCCYYFCFGRLCRALGGAEKVEIEWGNHSLSNRVQEAVLAIIDFVKREGPKGWDDPWS